MVLAALPLCPTGGAGEGPRIAWQVACRGASWPESRPNRAFSRGERLDYSVSWGAIPSGKAVLEVAGGETVDGRPAYRLEMELRSIGLMSLVFTFSDRTISWLDRSSLTTLRLLRRTREPRYAREEFAVLDQSCRRYYRSETRADQRAATATQGRLPGPTHDPLGYVYYLRALPLAVGGRYGLNIFSGGRVRAVVFTARRREDISVPAGRFDCIFLESEPRPGGAAIEDLRLWLSADARRLPVRLRFRAPVGHITAELAGRRHAPVKQAFHARNGGAGGPPAIMPAWNIAFFWRQSCEKPLSVRC